MYIMFIHVCTHMYMAISYIFKYECVSTYTCVCTCVHISMYVCTLQGSDEDKRTMQLKELNNGRLAMIAITGSVCLCVCVCVSLSLCLPVAVYVYQCV